MILLVPTMLATVLLVASYFASRCADSRAARRLSLIAALVTSCTAAGILLLSPLTNVDTTLWMPTGMLSVAPFVTALVAVISVGIAPLTTHKQSTFSKMLLLFAFAEAFLSTSHPLALAGLWAFSSYVAWSTYRDVESTIKWHRVFAAYHLLSIGCFGAGALLTWLKLETTAATVLLLIGIGIRAGILPVHSWFPRFVQHVPMGIVVAFVGPQLGVYAHLELTSLHELGPLVHTVAIFGAVTAVIAALLGVAQTDARRAIAFLIISQTGLVAFGLESHSVVGLAGALLNWQVLAIATSGFAMALAALGARRGKLELWRPSGNFSLTPKLATAFLILGFASVGFPLTLGFIAEDLLVQGTVNEFPVLGMSLIVATALNGVTVLRSFFYLFTGTRKASGEPDLCSREGYILGFVLLLLLGFGMMPNHLVRFENSQQRSIVHSAQAQVGGRVTAQ